jgi:hypothetical protein
MSAVTVLIMTNFYADILQTFLYLLNRGQPVVFSKLSTRNNAVYDNNFRYFYIKLLYVSTLKLIISQKCVKGH